MNYLTDYMTFCEGNECPAAFHYWSGISTLASAVSRKVWVEIGHFKFYPNLYVVLLGDSGSGKNTAIDIAKELVRRLDCVPLAGDCQSKESLVKDMSGYIRAFNPPGNQPPLVYCPVTIFATELSQFLSIDPAKMIDFLVTAYDARIVDAKTLKHGVQTIEGPFINMLVGTQPGHVHRCMRADLITDGLTRRCIFVFPPPQDIRRPFYVVSPEQREAFQRALAYLRTVTEVYGQFQWANGSKEWYEKWYLNRSVSKHPMVHGFDRRLNVQLLKVAMLLALGKGTELRLDVECLETAEGLLAEVLTVLPTVFEGMGRNELSAVAAKIHTLLLAAGPQYEKEVLKLMFSEAPTNELYSVINHMCSTDQLHKFEDSKGRIVLALPEHKEKLVKPQQTTK